MSNYLIHHGILGQKWGHMQGPPYPLGSGNHSSSEKSAAKSAGIKVGKSAKNARKQNKQISKEYHKLRNEALQKINSEEDESREKIYNEAVKRYDKKVKKGEVEYNPDDWDFDYEDRELEKLAKVSKTKIDKAYSDIDNYLSKKYNMSMDDFRKQEKANIEKGLKTIDNVTKGIGVLAAATLVGTMGYAFTHPGK